MLESPLKTYRIGVLIFGALLLAWANIIWAQFNPSAPLLAYKVIRKYPHDPTAFTQGLLYRDGFLYESTGLEGASSLRKVIIETGEVAQIKILPEEYFAEGITLFNKKIYLLTWRQYLGLILDLQTFDKISEFYYDTEGWGLTNDGKQLIMSDGSAVLRWLDPQSLQVTAEIIVTDGGKEVAGLNELEWIEGDIWANVWPTRKIAVIDPQKGQVKYWLDASVLLREVSRLGRVDVLNGIAYDKETKRIWLTGKLWPYLYQIEVSND
ncbi:MAG: glutaminyl-peptide cyclotransferase [Calditrichia bacterium]